MEEAPFPFVLFVTHAVLFACVFVKVLFEVLRCHHSYFHERKHILCFVCMCLCGGSKQSLAICSANICISLSSFWSFWCTAMQIRASQVNADESRYTFMPSIYYTDTLMLINPKCSQY